MYKKTFYITSAVWNNAFSFEKRNNKKLFVPSLIKINNFDDIFMWNEIVFEDFDFADKLQSCFWLRNFYEIDYKWKKVYLFDNHNHAYFFWHQAFKNWFIKENSTLVHIDEHADTRDPWVYLKREELNDLEKIFNYTNFTLNVWNYIIPAQKDWLISEIIQVRSETELLTIKEKVKIWNLTINSEWQNIILNIDLDFFQPDLDYIDYKLKKEVIQSLIPCTWVITVASSPFFINQKLALEVFYDLFSS